MMMMIDRGSLVGVWGSRTVVVHAPGVYRAYCTTGEIIEGTKEMGWTLSRFVRMVRQRNGWDWACDNLVK